MRMRLEKSAIDCSNQYIEDVVWHLPHNQFNDLTYGTISVLGYEHEFDRWVRYISQCFGMKE